MRSFLIHPDKDPKKPMSEREWRQAQASMTKMPTDVGSGLSAIGQALRYRSRKNPYPTAPGGNSIGKTLTGLFGLGQKGGIY